MIVIHIESGLGNQMLSYCEYLSLKYANPNQQFYLETIVYEIPECNDTICQWNGYELDRIFGIGQPENIRSLFSEMEWNQILSEIKASEFWRHNWNYPVVFTDVLNRHGLHLTNMRGDFDPDNNIITGTEYNRLTLRDRCKQSGFGLRLKYLYSALFEERYLRVFCHSDILFCRSGGDVFTGQWLSFKYRGNQIEKIDEIIRNSFRFPPITDARNKETESVLRGCNSVAVHARRGDMLKANGWCYRYGYFKRAVRYMKRHVSNPVFVFFTDAGNIGWCKDNAAVFDLDYSKDRVLFVDWNVRDDSYRDIQLMSCCKHAIITNSSFGWWGAYLIDYEKKITMSPLQEINTTNHC